MKTYKIQAMLNEQEYNEFMDLVSEVSMELNTFRGNTSEVLRFCIKHQFQLLYLVNLFRSSNKNMNISIEDAVKGIEYLIKPYIFHGTRGTVGTYGTSGTVGTSGSSKNFPVETVIDDEQETIIGDTVQDDEPDKVKDDEPDKVKDDEPESKPSGEPQKISKGSWADLNLEF